MRDKLKYINHLGEAVEFGKGNIVINENDFRNYAWTYENMYGRITGFQKSTSTKRLQAVIYGTNEATEKNDIFEILEKDVLAEKPGRMYVNDYYIEGYFFKSDKSDYTNAGRTVVTMQFITEDSFWKKEHPYTYRLNNEDIDDRGQGYNYDYPYDFLSCINTQSLNNPAFTESNCILRIYGQVSNPSISIGGNVYAVECEVLPNEYLTINTLEKTITRTTVRGIKISEFPNRSKEGYIFKKIAPGFNTVIAVQKCNVDIIIIEERSEPKWT